LGVVGTKLVKELRERGFDVVSCDLRHQHDEIGFGIRTDVIDPTYARADISSMQQIRRVFEVMGPFDFVYNCAAEFGRWNGEDFYDTLWQTNVVGTKNLIRLQEEFGFNLIHCSSSEVYGDWPDIMVEKVMDTYEIKQLNDYAMTKWVNEMQIHNSALQHGTQSVIVRIFNTYGPGEYYSPYRSVNCRFMYCALHNIPWVVFRGHSRTSTYIDSTVRTMANIVDNFRAGETYNICSKELHTIEQLSDIILELTGADPDLVVYQNSEILTTKDKVVDAHKAVQELGHVDRYFLREGLLHTMAWMKKVYKV
jgi:dTDP-glucose 4,6-dehydratase